MGYNQNLEEVEEVLVLEEVTEVGIQSQLIVYNDEVNTFDWVIQSFVDILKYNSEQAEQLSLLIHFKGKATVKTAPKVVLKPYKDALVDRGLSAVIESAK